MWIYQSRAPVRRPPIFPKTQQQPAESSSVPRTSSDSIRTTAPAPPLRRKNALTFLLLLMGCYLAGELCGSLLFARTSDELKIYTVYYYETILDLCQSGQWVRLFGIRFLSCFTLFTCVFFLGFCTFGAPLLPFVLFLKGVCSGCFFVQLFMENPQTGLIASVLLFWSPELLSVFLLIRLLKSAFCSAAALWRTSRGNHLHNLPALQSLLVRRYMAVCIGAVLPCGWAVLLCRIFSFVLD